MKPTKLSRRLQEIHESGKKVRQRRGIRSRADQEEIDSAIRLLNQPLPTNNLFELDMKPLINESLYQERGRISIMQGMMVVHPDDRAIIGITMA